MPRDTRCLRPDPAKPRRSSGRRGRTGTERLHTSLSGHDLSPILPAASLWPSSCWPRPTLVTRRQRDSSTNSYGCLRRRPSGQTASKAGPSLTPRSGSAATSDGWIWRYVSDLTRRSARQLATSSATNLGTRRACPGKRTGSVCSRAAGAATRPALAPAVWGGRAPSRVGGACRTWTNR